MGYRAVGQVIPVIDVLHSNDGVGEKEAKHGQQADEEELEGNHDDGGQR
jgi:hypothetical protein